MKINTVNINKSSRNFNDICDLLDANAHEVRGQKIHSEKTVGIKVSPPSANTDSQDGNSESQTESGKKKKKRKKRNRNSGINYDEL